MDTQEFQMILNRRIKEINNTIGIKAKEYALRGDRLHNFKIAARMKNETPAEALWGIAIKHLVSVEDLVKGRLEPTREIVDEKIGDIIVYMILLEAILTEKLKEEIKNEVKCSYDCKK